MFAENIWPATPTLLRSALVAYFAEARRVALTLTDVFALALGLPDFWFRSAARVRAGSAVVRRRSTAFFFDANWEARVNVSRPVPIRPIRRSTRRSWRVGI